MMSACSKQADSENQDSLSHPKNEAAHVEQSSQPIAAENAALNTPQSNKKPPLSDMEEKELIKKVESQMTADGASVLDVLRYVEKMRPEEFKISEKSVLYSDSGEPSVNFCYWIGAKRLEGDQYCDIAFETSPDGASFRPVVGIASPEEQAELTTVKLMKGRDMFLASIDMFYEENCVSDDQESKFC